MPANQLPVAAYPGTASAALAAVSLFTDYLA